MFSAPKVGVLACLLACYISHLTASAHCSRCTAVQCSLAAGRVGHLDSFPRDCGAVCRCRFSPVVVLLWKKWLRLLYLQAVHVVSLQVFRLVARCRYAIAACLVSSRADHGLLFAVVASLALCIPALVP